MVKKTKTVVPVTSSQYVGDENPVKWFNETRTLIEKGDIQQAKKMLCKEQIDKQLGKICDKELGYLARYDISLMLHTINRWNEALTYALEAQKIKESLDIYNLLGLIYRSLNKNTLAIEALTKANELDPENPHILNNLGLCRMKVSRTQETIDFFRKAVQADPEHTEGHSNLLFHLNYMPDIDLKELFEESKKWAQHKAPKQLAQKHHSNIIDPNRKLRIGYISPDFKEHSVMYFFDSLLLGHDRESFEIYGYGNVQQPDKITEQTIAKFDVYRNILSMENEQVAQTIQSDRIDILVELAGHTKDNSLRALAYKPAPIQITYCGYPNTTGMSQIDYRLTDAIVDPPEQQQYFTEKQVYLPNGFLCYNPGKVQPVVTASPAQTNNHITFGCFNNINKVNEPLMKMWVDILNAVPHSKLLLKFGEAKDKQLQETYLKQFEELGLANPAERIVLYGYLRSPKHLELYNAVDIALDTFPYNGTTTTFQSLLMGVPVITLYGDHHASRVGLDILTRLDLQFFATQTPEEYVRKAVALAMKPDSINQIRATMRQRLAASACCNYKLITGDIEKAYRDIWGQYCKTKINEKWEERSKKKSRRTPQPVKVDTSNRGVFYAIWGRNQKVEDTLQRSIQSVKQQHPELSIHVERFEQVDKINKTKIFDLSPFEETVFLDNDTVVLGSLDYGFEKANQFGLACCLNENPWSRRYCDERLSGDMGEDNSGVLFFSQKAKPLFDVWKDIFQTTDASIFHVVNNELNYMPVADQGSFALAMEQTGFNPFILPHNWNFRPTYHAHFSGPIKIWHGYDEVPQAVLDWNAEQTTENAVIKAVTDRAIMTGKPAS